MFHSFLLYINKSNQRRKNFRIVAVSTRYWFRIKPNIRGGMCMLPQHRGGACFCTRGAMQGYDTFLFIVALAKTVTPAGSPRREPGRAVLPTT
jgi:hypothetical protein